MKNSQTPENPARIRAQQVHALARLMPPLMIVNLVNAGTLVVVLYGTDQLTPTIAAWSVVLGFLSVRILVKAHAGRLENAPEAVSKRAVNRVVRSAALFGAVWAFPSMFVLPSVSGWSQVFAAALMTGMICGGAIALYPIPLAAVVYSGLVTAGALLGMWFAGNAATIGLTIIAASFFYIFYEVIQRHAQLFVSEFVARLDLEESHKSVARLLLETRSEATEEKKRSERRLADAQKMEAIGQLTGGIAHDFNNLLAVIQGNAELLEQLELGKESHPITSAIRHATGRGAELTQRLLAFSRKQSLRPKAINMRDLISDMSDPLQRMLGETIVVATRSHNSSWNALADPGQVEAALLNLGINARDAMPDGGKLTIECADVTLDEDNSVDGADITAGDYVVLSVTDQGVGMSEEIREHAFEPFFTTKGVGKGSGLGLSMVYGFAQQSGGQATIYTEEGQGTTVKLYLPRAFSEINREAVPKEEAVPRGNGETILVIEDDPDVRKLAEIMLGNLGYRVIGVEDAKAAQRHVSAKGEIALVLSDVVLPGGQSGPEFADELKTARPEVKVIFMSGYPTEAAKRNGFLGSDSVLLNKPFRVAQLARAVKEALA
ncbi:ATP-binding protein [Roseovarius sp. CAU 1744]|uniref:ATP-binding protein n=1 Tax=Roseovarius sp. CAU 1744 TaxID=3140368 RepID=UPI00325B1498